LQSDSLVAYAGDPLILAVISIAIVTGGLGPVVVVAAPAWLRGERVSLHARLVLGCTLGLLVAPAALIFALERTHALADRSIVDGLMNAWFQSVTTRTAGFNSVELGALRPATSYLMCLLMFVGGSPGSTAGGIKTTTLCVLALATVSVARGSASVRVGGRRLPGAILLDALAVTVATATAIAGGLLLLLLTQDINPSLLAFEVVSAVATVGLSLGITAELDEVGRVIVTLLMLIGRVGPLAVVCALLPHQPVPRWELPEERIPIG
ncbi:MAG: TrkH family potassium uptake protein, partial [Myxococcales bacterium]|nr:TrkH family potassium uptake protein [Myxococcales bacterium]